MNTNEIKGIIVTCPFCGNEIQGNYNYETGFIDYECSECGACYTEDDFMECESCGELCYKKDMHETEDGKMLCNDCFNEI